MTHTSQGAEHLSPEQIFAFIDRELPADERTAVERHLAECHACTRRALDAMQLKIATASSANRLPVPVDALARLAAGLKRQQPDQKPRLQPSQVRTGPFPAWIALAACLLLAASLIGWQQIRRTDTLSAELLDQHLASMSSGAVPEVLSTDRHTVKPWFQGRLPFSFNLPEVLPPDTVLRGGDLRYVDGRPAALLLFTIHQHQVSVFLTQRTSPSAALEPARPGTRSGFTLRYATTPDLRIAAVSDVNPSEIDRLVKSLAAVQ